MTAKIDLDGRREPAQVESFGGSVPGAQVHRVTDAGHVVNMEKPDEFNRLVLEFLSRHSAR